MNAQLYARAGKFYGLLKHAIGSGSLAMYEEEHGFLYRWSTKVGGRRFTYQIVMGRPELMYAAGLKAAAEHWGGRIKHVMKENTE